MKLVLIHGAGESSLSFYYQLRHFRNSKSIDLPGHPTSKPCTSVDGYVEWVRGFITARRYKDVVLCGHSMGGAITQMYSLKYPQELKGIILLGTGARLRVAPEYLKAGEEGTKDPAGWLEGRKASYSAIEPDISQTLLRRSAEVGPAVQLNDYRCCDKFDLMDQIQDISLPVQVVCGADDVMTPVKYSDYLAEKIPGAQQAVLEGAGHWVQLEKYREVNEIIEGFLAQLK